MNAHQGRSHQAPARLQTTEWLHPADQRGHQCVMNCAALAKVAEEKDPRAALVQCKYNNITQLTMSQHTRQHYFIAYDHSRFAYVCFHSFLDAAVAVTSMCDASGGMSGRVHAGYFRRAALGPHPVIVDLLLDEQITGVYLTGHGRGADVAAAAAFHCLANECCKDHLGKLRVVGFGATLVCNRMLAESLQEHSDMFQFYTLAGDTVPDWLWLCCELVEHRPRSAEVARSMAKRILALSSRLAAGDDEHSERRVQKCECLNTLFAEVLPEMPPGWAARSSCYYAFLGQFFEIKPTYIDSRCDFRARVVRADCDDIVCFPRSGDHSSQYLLEGFKSHRMEHYFRVLSEAAGNLFPALRDTFSREVHDLVAKWGPPRQLDLLSQGLGPSIDDVAKVECEVIMRKCKKESVERCKVVFFGKFVGLVRMVEISGHRFEVNTNSPMAGELSVCCSTPAGSDILRIRFFTDFGVSEEFQIRRQDFRSGGDMLTSKQELLSNAEPGELLNQALTYSLYVGARLMKTPLSDADRFKIEAPRRACFAQLTSLFKKIPGTDTAVSKEFATPDFRGFRDRFLYEKSALQKAEEADDRAAEDPDAGTAEDEVFTAIPRSDSRDFDEHEPVQVLTVEQLMTTFQEDQSKSSVDILRAFCPLSYLALRMVLSTPVTIAKRKSAVQLMKTLGGRWGAMRDIKAPERHAFFVGAAMSCAIFPVAFMAAGAGAVATAAISGIGMIVVGRTQLTASSSYNQRLDQMLRSLSEAHVPTFDDAYTLERALWDKCVKLNIIRDDDRQRKSVELLSPMYKLYNEVTYYKLFCHGVLWYVTAESMKVVVDTLIFALHMHALRNILADDFSVGVLGTGNVGKSTLIQQMFNFDTNPDYVERTLDIHPYCQIGQDRFHIVDFPHSNSPSKDLQDIFGCMSKFVDLAIVVIDVRHVDQDERRLVRWLARCEKDGRILDFVICLNCADTIVTKRTAGARNRRRRDEPPEAASVEVTPEEIQKLETVRLEAAGALKVNPDKVLLSAFKVRDCSKAEATQLGIKDADYIRDFWLETLLERHTNFTSAERVVIREYDHAAEMDKLDELALKDLAIAQGLGDVREMAHALRKVGQLGLESDDIANSSRDLEQRLCEQLASALSAQHAHVIQRLVDLAGLVGVASAAIKEAKDELDHLRINSDLGRTFCTSQFKQSYRPNSQGSLPDAANLFGYCESFLQTYKGLLEKKWTEDDQLKYLRRLKDSILKHSKKRMEDLDPIVLAVMMWSSADRLGGSELCFFVNDALRLDNSKLLAALMPFVYCLQKTLVNRSQPLRHATWPRDTSQQPVRTCYRGAGLQSERWAWFKAGRKFRVPFYFACSLEEVTALNFAKRSSMRHKVVFEILFPAINEPCACMHVCLLEDSLESGEVEFLFAPYSTFEVLESQNRTNTALGEHLWVRLLAAADNMTDESQPLLQWG